MWRGVAHCLANCLPGAAQRTASCNLPRCVLWLDVTVGCGGTWTSPEAQCQHSVVVNVVTNCNCGHGHRLIM